MVVVSGNAWMEASLGAGVEKVLLLSPVGEVAGE
jgi:hypothetical protein